MEGVPRITTPSKSSWLVSLFAVATTTAHNSVLPSVPAKAIFFIQRILSASAGGQNVQISLSNGGIPGQIDFVVSKTGALNPASGIIGFYCLIT
jgi:hypothetical protein